MERCACEGSGEGESHASGFPTRGRFAGATQGVFRGGDCGVKGLAGQCGGSGRDDGPGTKNTRSSPPQTDRRPASHRSIYSSQTPHNSTRPLARRLFAHHRLSRHARTNILVDIIEQVCRQSAACSRKGDHVIRYRAPRPAHSAARRAPCAHANGPLLPRRKRPRRSADRNELAAPGVRG